MMHGNRVAPLTNATNATANANFDALPSYESYDLAWLGPIVYPLSFALIAQLVVYYDMLKRRNRLCGRQQAHPRGAAPACMPAAVATSRQDVRVDLVVGFIMAAESVFAVLCIIQCALNFTSKAYVGGAAACYFQAFYATYYTFASLLLSAYGLVVGARVVHTQGQCAMFRPIPLALGGVAIHVLALFLAALPLFGVGGYLFANDYCQFNIEGSVYWNAFLAVYIIAAAAIVGSIGTMLCRTPPPHNAIKSHTANANATSAAAADGVLARWRAKRLLVGSAVYFAVAPTLTLAIGVLWVKNGDVFGSSEWRIYGAQAIILHTQQLVTPICFGWFLRHYLHAMLDRAAGNDREGGWKEDGVQLTDAAQSAVV